MSVSMSINEKGMVQVGINRVKILSVAYNEESNAMEFKIGTPGSGETLSEEDAIKRLMGESYEDMPQGGKGLNFRIYAPNTVDTKGNNKTVPQRISGLNDVKGILVGFLKAYNEKQTFKWEPAFQRAGVGTLDPKKTVVILPSKSKGMTGWFGARATYKDLNQYKAAEGGNLIHGDFKGAPVTLQLIPTLLNTIATKLVPKDELYNVVIDDSTHLQVLKRMSDVNNKNREKWVELGEQYYKMLESLASYKNLNIILIGHSAAPDMYGQIGLACPGGNMIAETIKPMSYFDVVLHTEVTRKDDGTATYSLLTQMGKDGKIAKSPSGLFPLYIPNDYQYVLDRWALYDEGNVAYKEVTSTQGEHLFPTLEEVIN